MLIVFVLAEKGKNNFFWLTYSTKLMNSFGDAENYVKPKVSADEHLQISSHNGVYAFIYLFILYPL